MNKEKKFIYIVALEKEFDNEFINYLQLFSETFFLGMKVKFM